MEENSRWFFDSAGRISEASKLHCPIFRFISRTLASNEQVEVQVPIDWTMGIFIFLYLDFCLLYANSSLYNIIRLNIFIINVKINIVLFD